MTTLKIQNPFNAPVYHEETAGSTMDISRELAKNGEPHGTVITADFQDSGRGRIRGRVWQMERELNLPFTILLHYRYIEEIPAALTLRTGLAVSLAIEDFSPVLQGSVKIKWPNDIMIGAKKAAGILCETDVQASENGSVHIGIGINFAQKEFPANLKEKATSIVLEAGKDYSPADRFNLLEKILEQLYRELEPVEKPDFSSWKLRLEQRLYKKGEQVIFIEGAAGSGREIKGRLSGIGENGELLILSDGEGEIRSFITGELNYF
jgi:BirA family biotin operon repressor/biotin-[acetyl-CoA-carboxylase] ligase